MPSTVIKKIEYNRDTSTLRIIYISGSVYDYLNVPPNVFEEMKNVFSKGIFLNNHIKGIYKFEKIVLPDS